MSSEKLFRAPRGLEIIQAKRIIFKEPQGICEKEDIQSHT
jgi:hypothetical protein